MDFEYINFLVIILIVSPEFNTITTLKYKNNLVVLIICLTIGVTALLLSVNPLTAFFEFERLNSLQLFSSIAIGFVSVMWYEIVKWGKRIRKSN